MGIDFSNKLIVAHPTIYNLGRLISALGLLAVAVGVVTLFTGDFILPAMAWDAGGVPVTAIGGILVWCGVVKG